MSAGLPKQQSGSQQQESGRTPSWLSKRLMPQRQVLVLLVFLLPLASCWRRPRVLRPAWLLLVWRLASQQMAWQQTWQLQLSRQALQQPWQPV